MRSEQILVNFNRAELGGFAEPERAVGRGDGCTRGWIGRAGCHTKELRERPEYGGEGRAG